MNQCVTIFWQHANTITRLIMHALSGDIQFNKAHPCTRPWISGDSATPGTREVDLLVASNVTLIAHG